jgi:ketosteroid isomerase-like protein
LHPNERRVRELYEAIDQRDIESLFSMWAEDAVLTIPGSGPLAGRYEGREAIFGALGRAVELTGGTFSTELLGVLANDSYGVALHRWTASRDGRSVAANNIIVYRFSADGLIVERSELLEDESAHDAFWGASSS